jgi:hypothetical protein
MAAVRHRLPENRAGRLTAALAGPSAVVCAVAVLVAWVSQGRPGATPWVAAPPPMTAPPWATASPAPSPTPAKLPSATTPARSLVADNGTARPSSTRRAHSAPVEAPVERRTTTPARTPSPSGRVTKDTPAGGLVGSILALVGRLLGHNRGGHPPPGGHPR